MKYASVCSGVEAASLAWMPLGWQAAWFSEIEPFPCAVLKKRYPNVPNLGDMTKIRVENLQNGDQKYYGADGTNVIVSGGVDLLVGGTPCQGFSVAGKQDGLNDDRSVLCLTYIKLLETMRPRWFVWENVPGVFSTNEGNDFKEFIRQIDEIGYHVAWRVLDAQYVRVDGFPRAVPQRRRRVFVIGHLGGWQYPAEVLFEPNCLFRDTPPCRVKGKGFTTDVKRCVDSAKSIRMHSGKPGGGKGALIGDDLSHTLATGNDQTIVAFEKANGFNFDMWSGECDEHSPTLMEQRAGDTMVYGGTKPPVWWNGADKADTLTCTSDRQLMPDKGRLQCVIEADAPEIQCLNIRQADVYDQGVAYKGGNAVVGEVCPTLDASYPGKINNQDINKLVCYENHPQDSRVKEVKVAQAITARMGTGGGNLPIVKEPETLGFIKNDAGGELQHYWNELFPTMHSSTTPAVALLECFNVSFCDANGVRRDRPNGGLYVTEAETSKTVTAGGPNTETVVIALDGDKMKPGERAGGSGMGVSEDGVMYTQTAKDVHAVAYEEAMGIDQYNGDVTGKASSTLGVNCGMSTGRNGVIEPKEEVTQQINSQATVRRLLPVECERLMGFPDNHTRIVWKGKPEEDCPDAPRYKACGNSMCVNVMRWIGLRIENVERKTKK